LGTQLDFFSELGLLPTTEAGADADDVKTPSQPPEATLLQAEEAAAETRSAVVTADVQAHTAPNTESTEPHLAASPHDEDLPLYPEETPDTPALPSPVAALESSQPALVSSEPPPFEPFEPAEEDIFSAAEDLPWEEEMPPLSAPPMMELAAITQLLDDPLPVARPTPPEPPAPPALSPLAEQLAAVAQQCAACTRCGLHKSRTQTVFADGNPQARLMIIGEGPGQNEDETGIPFVGKAGQLLTKMLESVGLNRAEDTYIANIVKCRPPQNRTPTPEEMAACLTHLRAQINLVQPRLIVLAGGTAVKGLLGNIGGITKVRGTWRTWQGIPCMPIFHPSYLLRNESRAVGSPKWETWQDLKAIYARYQALDTAP
jgi:DNA polymerase